MLCQMSGFPLVTTLIRPYGNSLYVNVQTADPSSIPLPKQYFKCEYAQYNMFMFHWMNVEGVTPDDQGNFTISGLSNSTTYVVRCNYQESATSPIITGKNSDNLITLSVVDDLKIKNEEMINEIAMLKEQLRTAPLKEQLRTAPLKEQLRTAPLKNTRYDMISELSDAQFQIDKLTATNRSFMSEIAALKSKITDDTEKISRIASERDNLSEEITRLRNELRIKETQFTEYEMTIECTANEIVACRQLVQDFKRLKEENHRIMTEKREISADNAKLANIVCTTELQVIELLSKLSHNEKLVNELSSRIQIKSDDNVDSVAEQQIEEIQEKLTEEINRISREKDTMSEEIMRINKKLSYTSVQVYEGRAIIENLRDVEAAYKQLVQDFERLKEENQRIMTERSQFETTEREKIKILESEKSVYVSTIKQLETNIEKLKQEKHTIMVDRVSFEKAIIYMENKRERMEKQFKHVSDDNAKLTDIVHTTKQQVVELQEKLARSEEMVNELYTAIQSISGDNTELKGIAHATEQQIVELQEKLGHSEEMVKRLSHEVYLISRDLADFKGIASSANQQVDELQEKLRYSEEMVNELSNTNAKLRNIIHSAEQQETELRENLRLSEQIASELTHTIQELLAENAKLKV